MTGVSFIPCHNYYYFIVFYVTAYYGSLCFYSALYHARLLRVLIKYSVFSTHKTKRNTQTDCLLPPIMRQLIDTRQSMSDPTNSFSFKDSANLEGFSLSRLFKSLISNPKPNICNILQNCMNFAEIQQATRE